MKKIFIHLGLHKTGTTSIQVCLYKNRERLKKHGFLYPKSCCPEISKFGHHLVPWSFVSRKEFVPAVMGMTFDTEVNDHQHLRDLKKEIEESECDNIILSSEEFDILSNEDLSSLFVFLSDYEIVPLFYIRSLPTFLESSYQTSVVFSGYHETFENYVGNQRSRLDFGVYFEAVDRLSKGNAIALSYDGIKRGGKLLEGFFEVIGISPDALDLDIPNQNTSLPLYTVEIFRHFNSKKVGFDVIRGLINDLHRLPKSKEFSLFDESTFDALNEKYIEQVSKITSIKKIIGEVEIPDYPGVYLENNLINSILKVVKGL